MGSSRNLLASEISESEFFQNQSSIYNAKVFAHWLTEPQCSEAPPLYSCAALEIVNGPFKLVSHLLGKGHSNWFHLKKLCKTALQFHSCSVCEWNASIYVQTQLLSFPDIGECVIEMMNQMWRKSQSWKKSASLLKFNQNEIHIFKNTGKNTPLSACNNSLWGEELYATGIINTGISWWRILNASKVSLSFIFYQNMLIWSVDIKYTQLFMIYKKVISELFSLFTYWKLYRGITYYYFVIFDIVPFSFLHSMLCNALYVMPC